MKMSLLRRWAGRAFQSLCGGIISGIAVAASARTVAAHDGCQLTTYRLAGPRVTVASGSPRAIVFFLQGSGDGSVLRAVPQLAGFVLMGMSVVLVERRGVMVDGSVDDDVARRFATKGDRTRDALAVIRTYLAELRPETPVLVVGFSEGGDIAASVAMEEPRVTHLVLIGTGGGWSQADELRHFVRQRGTYLGIQSVEDLDARFEEIRARPGADDMWLGHPFRRWSSYLWSPPADDLLRLEIPILLLHGAKDESVPVESARAVLAAHQARGKKNLRYVEYPSLDHSLLDVARRVSGVPLVELDAVAWLTDTGISAPTERRRLEDRVRANHPEWFHPG